MATTWYLAGWDFNHQAGVPATSQPPTLRFRAGSPETADNATAAAFDGASTYDQPVKVAPGAMTWGSAVAGTTSTATPVSAAMRTVLAGVASWQVRDGRLEIWEMATGNSLQFISTPPPTADSSVKSLIDRKWYLTTVHRYGHSWAPGATSTLTFSNVVSGDTDDGSNDTSWDVRLSPGSATWKQQETTAVSESSLSYPIYGALVGVLKGTTAWTVRGDALRIGADEAYLEYTDVEPPAPRAYSGALVFLDNDPPGGQITGGQSLSLIGGQVTVTDAKGEVAWSGLVAEDDGGDSHLPPGPYTITAVVQGGTCTPLPVTIVADQVGEFTLVCTTTQPTVAQH